MSLELVLAIDVSASVNSAEFNLQIQGIAQAFRRPDIIQLIELHPGGVAVAVAQWSEWAVTEEPSPWYLVTDAPSADRFARAVGTLPRYPVGHFTAIGHAVDFALEMLETNAYHGRLRKIDVSGDGRSNAGHGPDVARDRAVGRGVIISGLAILTDDPGLTDYYREQVIGGPAAFVISTRTYDDFATAMAKKLVRELTIFTAAGEGARQ